MKHILLFGFMALMLATGNIVSGQENANVKAPSTKVAKPKTDSAKVVKKTTKPKATPAKATTTKPTSVKATKPLRKTDPKGVETAVATTETAPVATEGIHWLTINEVQEKMREKPKKVFIDFYTSWCGWCKKMEATTYTNPALVKYVNNNFYAVRFDAETQQTFQFNGKEYHFDPQYKASTFAVEMMLGPSGKGQMGYPTTVFMMEDFKNPNPIGGYHPVSEMEMFLLFFGDNICMHKQFEDYRKTFVSAWDKSDKSGMAPGH
jgi:thioredoxin-related protein